MVEVVFIGLSLASVLLLVALGLAITYGAMGVINMAHGEMVMLGAYTTVMTGLYLKFSILAAIPLAFIVTALVGYAIERVVVRRLYGRLLDTLLATWGVAILIQQAVRLELGLSFFGRHIPGLGPGLQNVTVPDALTGVLTVGGVQVNAFRSFIIIVTLILTLFTWLLMYRTSIGIQVRAIMRNSRMAAACGIDVDRINALTFAYGSGLAGVAGVLISGFKTVFPDMGTPMVVDGVPGRGGRRCRQPGRFCLFRRSARADQRRDGLLLQRHPRPRGGVRVRDPHHHDEAAWPVRAERAVRHERQAHTRPRSLRDLHGADPLCASGAG